MKPARAAASASLLTVIFALGALAALTCATSASASPEYTPEMQRHLALDYVPRCALCHADAYDGGATDGGAVDTPFARSMIARGLRGGGDLASLDTALDAMKRDRVDSDGDGAFDLDEIAYGRDPNVPSLPEGGARPVASYGCDAVRGRGRAADDGGALVVVFAGALALLRRARLTPRRRSFGHRSLDP